MVGGACVASRQSAIRENANVVGRWHDRHFALVTNLAESGAGDEVIMSIAGHVSLYSHVRMEAKRRALDEIAARQRAADEKRRGESPQFPIISPKGIKEVETRIVKPS